MSETSGRWATFAGGLLLGGVVATGAAYLALKYAPSQPRYDSIDGDDQPRAGHRRRHGRPSSPAPRHPSLRRIASQANGSGMNGNAGVNGTSNGTAPLLTRTGTDVYYELPLRENGTNNVTPEKEHVRTSFAPSPNIRRAGSNRAPPPPPPPYGVDPRHPLFTVDDVSTPGARLETQSESEPVGMSAQDRSRTAIFAGPADRGNPAAVEALRITTAPTYALSAATQQAVHMHQMHQAPPSTPGSAIKYGESPGGASTQMRSPMPGQTPSPGPGGHSPYPPPPPVVPHHGSAMNPLDVLATEGRIIEDAALHEHYSRVITPEPPPTEETEEVCYLLQQALEERKRWLFKPYDHLEGVANVEEATKMRDCFGGEDPFACQLPPPSPLEFEMVDGVMAVYDPSSSNPGERLFGPPGTATEFFSTMHWLLKVSSLGHVRSFTHHRLQLLEQKFNLHVMLNADKEFLAQKSAPHRDFYNVRKVDTHVHHSACMHQKHLLRFIKSKLKKEPDEVVIFRDGKYLTLKEVFESLNLTPYDLSVDTLDVHADKNIFHRFDKFNLKYNPFGQSRLREVFIKQDNLIHGRFLAELTREVFIDLEASKYQHTEYRISVYGRKPVEWDTLAAWVVQNRLYSDNNRWMIQVPRLYNVYKSQGLIECFQQLLDNIFTPLFEVSVDPGSHPMLHLFLRHVSGFDLVDDESKPERRPSKHMPTPTEWTSKHNPAYAYYAYYMYANLYVLNRLREARGLNTFSLRPHAGEAGDMDHLATTFLLAENIAHGINLRKSPCLQYLYYAAQVGLCMSPLSNNSLFLDYHKNPFPQFFARGLSVSLSTDDPLQIHLTREPLVEEYSVAAQVWKFSGTDLCEIARNSVLHSGFPRRLKMHWVSREFQRMGPEGNNIQKTNVPALRMVFRKDCHGDEVGLLAAGAVAHAARLRAKEAYLES